MTYGNGCVMKVVLRIGVTWVKVVAYVRCYAAGGARTRVSRDITVRVPNSLRHSQPTISKPSLKCSQPKCSVHVLHLFLALDTINFL